MPKVKLPVARGARGRIAATVLLALTLAVGLGARIYERRAPVDPVPVASPPPVIASPGGPVSFTGQLDRSSVLVGGDGLLKMELVIRGEERRDGHAVRVPTDLIVVLDRSGSMAGLPLQHAKAAVRELISQLGNEDRFALVSYASGARLTIPLSEASLAARDRWQTALDRVRAQGGTNMASGLDLASSTLARSRQAGRAPRILLLSDGHANEGDHSLAGLSARAGAAVAGEYVLSTVGVGQGFDESLMTALADAGTGNFYYVQNLEGIAQVFTGEFAAARKTVASLVAVRIEPGAGVHVVDAAGYPLERTGGAVQFRPGSLFAGQERRIWLTLRAPTHELRAISLGDFIVSYREQRADAAGVDREVRLAETPQISCVAGEDEFYSGFDGDVWARAVMVDDYNALRQRVSVAVRSGDRGAALGSIRSFRGYAEEQNAKLKRADVAESLSALDAFEAEVEEALRSPAARNSLSKSLSAESLDARRTGAKH